VGAHIYWEFSFIWTGGEFGTLKELVDALKEETTDAILIDMYTPIRRKDLFNGSWFEISEIVNKGISHGIALGGISETLAKDFQEMIRDRNVQTKFLTDDDENHQQVIANEQAERRRLACGAASLLPREVLWQAEKS